LEYKVIWHKYSLIAGLFLNMKKKYRLEVEDYYLGSSDQRYLHHYYFNSFEEATCFVTDYHAAFYLIRLVKQNHRREVGCNLITGELLTPEIEASFRYISDRYGFIDIPVYSPDGWYFRGENLHHPDFVAITQDLDGLAGETFRRFMNSFGIRNQRQIIKEIFAERFPNSAEHYQRNFSVYYGQWLKVRTQEEETRLRRFKSQR
jgi:hypothetical protein